jgi:hypothetical protein
VGSVLHLYCPLGWTAHDLRMATTDAVRVPSCSRDQIAPSRQPLTLLENIEIPVLGGIPKIPKLFDFGLILADYGNFQQPCIASSRFWQFSTKKCVDIFVLNCFCVDSLQLVWTDSGRFSYIWIWLTGPF